MNGVKVLLPFLKENTSIESLDLSGCDVTEDAMPLLADLLMVPLSLLVQRAWNSSFLDRQLQALRPSDQTWERSLRTTHDYDDANALRNRPFQGLKRLNLSANPLSNAGVLHLLETMRRHGPIQGISCFSCAQIDFNAS